MARQILRKVFRSALCVVLTLQPALIEAQSITPETSDGAGRKLDQASNGTDVLNIATPVVFARRGPSGPRRARLLRSGRCQCPLRPA